MNDLISMELLRNCAPKSVRERIDEEFINTVNSISDNEQYRELFRDNFLSYLSVLQDGKYKIGDYLNAVKYVSYKLLGNSNLSAYTKTFPDRVNRMLAEGNTDKDISSFVSAYNKNQLVNKVFEQSFVPTHILNADIYQKAINVQADLMMNANSEKVRSDAANSLLTHLKPPETAKIKLDIGIQQDNTISELRAATQALVDQQRLLLEEKLVNIKDIAHSNIIEGEYV